LIEWVWRRIESMSVLDHAVVATDSEEIAEVCRSFGAPVEMTSSVHPSGTDRVAEVAERPFFSDFGVIANIQGDEPLLQEVHVEAAVSLVRDDHWDIGTCGTPLLDHAALDDPSAVKVIRATSGRALYFSRGPIPCQRDGTPSLQDLGREPFLRHVGVYAYSRGALERWGAMAPTHLERLEDLEQLRPLEGGLRMGVAVVGAADHGVDTPADVVRMEQALTRIETLRV
jgi:3-deoxy-manno-octulosonate cytidylyltransferase (CMP-KDO synthetase)